FDCSGQPRELHLSIRRQSKRGKRDRDDIHRKKISWKKLTANCLLSRKQKKKMMKKNRNHLAQWQNDNQKKSGKRPFYSTKNTGGNQSCDSPY
ncbi:hypothetical protein UQ10_29010, partial [Escherichia coli]